MKKKYFNLLYIGLLISAIFGFSKCANIGTITGGPKDSIPPEVLASRPVLNDTGFNEKKIVIYFDEYFELKDINQEFFSSPPFEETPDFKVKKRSLHVKFNEPLKDSVTYALKFRNAIADFNEGNILENYKFIFSTKSEIDTFAISGNLRNAFDLEVPEEASVYLFETNEDSIPFKSLPNYMSKIDTSGNFIIDYIKPGSYKIFALSDLNTNKKADDFEPRAFLDSLIIPEITPFTKIDSIKAGTILHDIEDGDLSDSLQNDTVIITSTYKTHPSHLQLYLFEEEKTKQRLLEYKRDKRGRVDMNFDLPIDSSFSIEPLNFVIRPENMILERNLSKDSLILWINDTILMAMDTLEVNVSYLTIDSLGEPIMGHDTLLLEYREKKKSSNRHKQKRIEEEAKKKKYVNINYLANENKVEMDKKLRFESPVPLINLDTSKIRLFEIYDTTTVDPKRQEIVKAYRLRKDFLQFKFSRPVAKDFNLYPINFDAENWYSFTSSDTNRVFNCTITNQEVALMDTIKLIAEFDNNFFFEQIQVLNDSLVLPITGHKITNRKRELANKIDLVFYKPLISELQVIPDDFEASGNWYNISKNNKGDTVTINLLDRQIVNKDTLTFAIRCFDYIDINNDSVFFEETMRLTYRDRLQYLVMASRLKSHEINLVFNKRLYNTPIIEPIGFTLNTKWYDLQKNKDGDTLKYIITDKFISDMDTINLIFKYSDRDRKGTITNFVDTLELTKRLKKDFRKKSDENKAINKGKGANKDNEALTETVNVYLPRNYELLEDSLFIRQYLIGSEWKEKTKYLLRLDSMALTDIYGIYNQSEDYEFETRENDYYTVLLLNLNNIRATKLKKSSADSLSMNIDSTLLESNSDSIVIDSTGKEHLPEKEIVIPQELINKTIGDGNIIIQLLGKDRVIVKEYFISEDQEILMDYLHPGDYELRIIFDKNNNKEWDTGNYFNGIQPERTIMNGKVLQLKSNFENKLEWDVGKSLIESFTAD